jgi:hypothetical protein
MKFSTMVRTIAATAALAATALALPCSARAGRLGPDIIGLFPKEVGEFAYADLKQARSLKWFAQLKEQLIPARFKQFEQFLASAGIDPNTQVDELAWGLVAESMSGKGAASATAVPTGENIVGVALGSYNPSSAEAFFKTQKLPTLKVRGYTLFAFGTGSGPNDLFFFFLDSNTAAFGHRALLEKMIEVRFGGEDGLLRNETLYPLINEANNGSGVVWAVLNPAYTRLAIRQLAPEIEQFPEAAKLVRRMKNLIINVDAGSSVDGHFQAVAGSTDDANSLSQLLQAGFLYKRYQAQQNNPELAQLLDQVRVNPTGDRVDLRMSVNDDQMSGLIKHNTFALKM